MKLLDHAKQSATYALKTVSKTATQKTADAIGDLIGTKLADKIMKVLRASTQKSSDTATNETGNIAHDKETPKERYISPEKREKTADDLRLI